MDLIILIGLISCFTSVLGQPISQVNSTHGNVCGHNQVWDDEYKSCVQSCSAKENYCHLYQGVCDLVEAIPRCKCAPGHRWDPVRQSCIHACWEDRHCDCRNEFCDMFDDRYIGNCACIKGYSWDNQSKICRKTCTSVDMECPGQYEKCYDYSTHCTCEHTARFYQHKRQCDFWP